MDIDIENLPGELKFAYIAMTKSALFFKQIGRDKNFFLMFCDEIWKSMELSDMHDLNDVLQKSMQKDVESYIKSKK